MTSYFAQEMAKYPKSSPKPQNSLFYFYVLVLLVCAARTTSKDHSMHENV